MYAGSLDGKTKKLVMQSNWNGYMRRKVYLLYRAGVALMAAKFSADRLQLDGEPFTVVEQMHANENGMPAASVSGTGALAYASSAPRIGRLTWFNRSGNRLESVGPEGRYLDLRLSPDQRRLAATVVPRMGNYNIWLTDLARGATTPFTFSGANE